MEINKKAIRKSVKFSTSCEERLFGESFMLSHEEVTFYSFWLCIPPLTTFLVYQFRLILTHFLELKFSFVEEFHQVKPLQVRCEHI